MNPQILSQSRWIGTSTYVILGFGGGVGGDPRVLLRGNNTKLQNNQVIAFLAEMEVAAVGRFVQSVLFVKCCDTRGLLMFSML